MVDTSEMQPVKIIPDFCQTCVMLGYRFFWNGFIDSMVYCMVVNVDSLEFLLQITLEKIVKTILNETGISAQWSNWLSSVL